VDEIELALQQRGSREVSSNEIGELVLEQLRAMSEVAYVRFASVYRQFRSVSDFVATLEGLGRVQTSGVAGKEHLAVVV
jgi:transcriptional repressor NrdR